MDIYGYDTGFVDFPNMLAITLFFPGCNLACPYCYNKDLVNAVEGRVDMDEISGVLARAEGNLRTNLGVVFSGGEPAVHPKFNEYIDLFRSQGRKLALHTNGLAPFRDKFDSIVLSVKTTVDGIRDLPAYRKHMNHVLERELHAERKELRIVNAAVGREERSATMAYVADAATANGWRINLIEPFERRLR